MNSEQGPGQPDLLNAPPESLSLVEKKLEGLRALGVRAAGLERLSEEAKSGLSGEGGAEGRRKLDELLMIFSVLAEEIETFLGRMESGAPGGAAEPGPQSSLPTLEEIEGTVEEAFLKHLHSSGLRRMVEVIALEKVRSALSDDEFYEKVVKKGVLRALGELGVKRGAHEPAGGEKAAGEKPESTVGSV